jgi:hypothetical protein
VTIITWQLRILIDSAARQPSFAEADSLLQYSVDSLPYLSS